MFCHLNAILLNFLRQEKFYSLPTNSISMTKHFISVLNKRKEINPCKWREFFSSPHFFPLHQSGTFWRKAEVKMHGKRKRGQIMGKICQARNLHKNFWGKSRAPTPFSFYFAFLFQIVLWKKESSDALRFPFQSF